MLKIHQAKLCLYLNWELPDVQAGFRQPEEPEIKLPTSFASQKKQENSRKTSASFTMPNLWLCGSQQTGKFLKREEYQSLLRNLYAGIEATVRTRNGTMNWFQIGKGTHQGCILSPCLLNLYAEYIMWRARLDEAQAGTKIAGRNINNLRYAADTYSHGIKWRTKEPLYESERKEWKHWLKTQHSEN